MDEYNGTDGSRNKAESKRAASLRSPTRALLVTHEISLDAVVSSVNGTSYICSTQYTRSHIARESDKIISGIP